MAHSPALLKQAELTRYLKATVAAGVSVGRVVIGPDGTVTIHTSRAADEYAPNPWDAK